MFVVLDKFAMYQKKAEGKPISIDTSAYVYRLEAETERGRLDNADVKREKCFTVFQLMEV